MNTKLIAALVIVGVLAIAVIGLVSARSLAQRLTEHQTEQQPMAFSAGWADISDLEEHNTMG